MASTTSLLEQSRNLPLVSLQKDPPSSSRQSENYEFITLKRSSPHFEKVEKVFREILEPLYGSQDSSIEKIKAREDRKSELLLYNDNPVGLIVYKKEKQDEFSKYGIRDSFELKTFLVIDRERNAEKGYDILLLNRVLKLARRKFATSVHLTAPEQYNAGFFRSKGFSVTRTWKDKYVQGVTEHLLCLNLPKRKSGVIKTKESSLKVVEEETTKKSKRKINASPETILEDRGPEKLKKQKKQVREEERETKSQEREDRHAPVKGKDDRRGYDYYQRDNHYTQDYRDSHSFSRREDSFDSGRQRANKSFSSNSRKKNFHEITLRKKYIHQIKGGGKTIEGRINSGMILRFNPGDEVRFFYKQNQQDDVRCNIEDIRKYSSFRHLLQQEGHQNCLTDVRSLEEAVRIYDQIPGYAERAAKFGVVAIHLSLK